MRKLIFTLVIMLLILKVAQAQSNQKLIIRGVVANAQTQEPIPYANIGIIGAEVGTLSNKDGSFSVKIPQAYIDKGLIFSSIGYKRKSIPVNSINRSKLLQVSLTESILALEEVVLRSKKFKKQQAVFGNNKSVFLHGFYSGDTLYSGNAVALLIDKGQNSDLHYIQKASLHIAINKMPAFKVRMRILAVDSTNGMKPGEDLLFDQVIVESSIRKGWLDFPLEQAHQIKENAFYLTFEWLIDKEDRKYMNQVYEDYIKEYPDRVRYDTAIIDGETITNRILPSALTGTFFGITNSKKDLKNFVSYDREHSFDDWNRMGDILSAKIEMANYPLETDEQ